MPQYLSLVSIFPKSGWTTIFPKLWTPQCFILYIHVLFWTFQFDASLEDHESQERSANANFDLKLSPSVCLSPGYSNDRFPEQSNGSTQEYEADDIQSYSSLNDIQSSSSLSLTPYSPSACPFTPFQSSDGSTDGSFSSGPSTPGFSPLTP